MQQLDDVTGYAGRSRDALPLLLPKLLKEENINKWVSKSFNSKQFHGKYIFKTCLP